MVFLSENWFFFSFKRFSKIFFYLKILQMSLSFFCFARVFKAWFYSPRLDSTDSWDYWKTRLNSTRSLKTRLSSNSQKLDSHPALFLAYLETSDDVGPGPGSKALLLGTIVLLYVYNYKHLSLSPSPLPLVLPRPLLLDDRVRVLFKTGRQGQEKEEEDESGEVSSRIKRSSLLRSLRRAPFLSGPLRGRSAFWAPAATLS